MAGALPRFAIRRDRMPRALARALYSTAFARIPPEEQEWIERIECRRLELGSEQAAARGGFGSVPEDLPDWAVPFDQAIPIWVTNAWLSIPPVWGSFLLRLVRELAPRSCLELGTGLGISAAYQAAALDLNREGRLITLDAARDWAAIAKQGLSSLGLGGRVEQRLGAIDGTLETALRRAAPVDYVFVDAEHQEAPTLDYLETMVPYLSDRAVLAFDDIDSPRQMRRTWRTIKRHTRVSAALGLGRMGIVVISAK
jgi:predicted O-methyltransferase YrrM